MKKRPLILIDPGHGGDDPGAVADRVREAALNLRVALQLGPMLFGEKFDVHYTRYFDQTVPLANRVALANALNPDLFLSLHCNAARDEKANGLEIFTSPGETASDRAALSLYQSLKRRHPARLFRTDYSDGDPDKESSFYVLTKTECPAVLLEMGFITNPLERDWLLVDSTTVSLSLTIVSALLDWRQSL